ncbi:Sec1 family protein [Aspergillus clavatus NRRL 1]|uniref:Sec1 family superfamily n=1 Tax=Aspergillus clavatus (strain ATCC 1007 / CBS 513.65 / DSM 816 / NCTC 3887 / NRRL 1 / QM 1276 / 107) TaxID=344612 RepID=A1CB18_ASPCL|nr:Sec1 family superfamily [Aspergillus clavatus NRRL 1]EAW12936.1 Sec1 family superfamily [Aspergillus clavatus NRRL 1]
MGSSIIDIQRDAILSTIRRAAGNDVRSTPSPRYCWKVLVVDETSRKLIYNATNDDDILNLNVTNVEQIEHRRPCNPDMDALYILSPLTHIVDCLMADFERRRYRKAWLVWTSALDPQQRARLDRSQMAREQIADFRVLNIDFFPRESRLVTFRDPWSFPVLFHPGCNHLIRGHLQDLAQKVVSLCVTLGEYPVIRYYRPRASTHEASVLCSHLARFVQNELDQFAQSQRDFPPPSARPRGVLLVVDRSMDMIAPLVHEFTYQSMVHDLLPIKDGDKVTYTTVINAGSHNEDKKEMEINEEDHVWVEYRHQHMKDVLERLGEDFAKFRAANPQFAEDNDKANVNTIKDMLAGLTEFQKGRDAYTLHLNMAEECMRFFQEHKLLEVSSVEQCLATGLDENYKKAKNLASQLVQLLDDDAVMHPDRLRLLLLYVIYRGGILGGDIRKLMAHAQLAPQDGQVISNLDLLGIRAEKGLKDEKPPMQPLFNRKPPHPTEIDETSLSRYDLNVKLLLEELARGILDPTTFPFTKPQTADGMGQSDTLAQASLRSAKPTWARTRGAPEQPRQRIILFMAGGATYGEARACYEASQAFGKDVYLATSHMLTPGLFLRQLSDLSADQRRLDIPAERPKPSAPAHLFEKDPPPPAPQQPAPKKAPAPSSVPTAAMNAMSLGPNAQKPAGGSVSGAPAAGSHKPHKEKKEKEKKKLHHFFR